MTMISTTVRNSFQSFEKVEKRKDIGLGGPNLSQVLTGLQKQISVNMPVSSGELDIQVMADGCSADDPLDAVITRKSGNMTERVVVPSSEHVAEIVGRQGCKIKALRNKTNTYIKTPVRGEDPVFVVTGRREDVDAARREIMAAAEHFSHIRATRSVGFSKNTACMSTGTAASITHLAAETDGSRSSGVMIAEASAEVSTRQSTNPAIGGSALGPHTVTDNATGQVTVGVRVPISMVGLVVGPKGATIKRIQQDTGTYIVTPGRNRDPVFEIIGTPIGVNKARRQIDAYLETRSGASSSSTSGVFGMSIAQTSDCSRHPSFEAVVKPHLSVYDDKCNDNAENRHHVLVDTVKHEQLLQDPDKPLNSTHMAICGDSVNDVNESGGNRLGHQLHSSVFPTTKSNNDYGQFTSPPTHTSTEPSLGDLDEDGLFSLFLIKMLASNGTNASLLSELNNKQYHNSPHHHSQHQQPLQLPLQMPWQQHRLQECFENEWPPFIASVTSCASTYRIGHAFEDVAPIDEMIDKKDIGHCPESNFDLVDSLFTAAGLVLDDTNRNSKYGRKLNINRTTADDENWLHDNDARTTLK